MKDFLADREGYIDFNLGYLAVTVIYGVEGDNRVGRCLIGDWADFLIWHEQPRGSQ